MVPVVSYWSSCATGWYQTHTQGSADGRGFQRSARNAKISLHGLKASQICIILAIEMRAYAVPFGINQGPPTLVCDSFFDPFPS